MVRALTDAEAQVIGALLSSERVTERARLQRAQVPRSTYHAARRRAYQEGWLRDRYIPNPVQFGLPFSVILVARPFVDRQGPFVDDRLRDPSTVYLARSPTTVVSIGWYETEADAARVAAQPGAGNFAGWSFSVVSDLRSPSVPVYFDFEGSFAHLGKSAGPEGYPQGLGGAPADARRSERPGRELRDSWAAAELVHRPFALDGGAPRPPHLVGPLGLPWGQQKMLNQGWIHHRVLLDPGRLPPFQGRAGDQQVLIGGTLKDGARPDELFATLTRNCRVFPFLFAVGDGRLLIGALGQSAAGTMPDDGRGGRSPVMRTLRDRLEGIEVIQEAAPAFQVELDHRYDRLFPRRAK